LVEDVRLVRQRSSAVSVEFAAESVADLFDELVDARLPPERFSRIWIHTHPGSSPRPSSVDEATFAEAFGTFHWSVMFIVARGGATYARLQYRLGPGGAWELPVSVDYGRSFAAADHGAWRRTYEALVTSRTPPDFAAEEADEEPPDDWPFGHQPWEEFLNDPAEYRPLHSPKRSGADRPAAEGLGDGDRRGSDRPPTGPAVDGLGSPEAAIG
jgi:hypothetical protein